MKQPGPRRNRGPGCGRTQDCTQSLLRSRAARASANSTGSTGSVTAASARLQVASQASCGRPISSSTGGQWKISSLISPADAHAARRGRLAVQHAHVDAAVVQRGQDGGQRGALHELHRWHVRRRPATGGEPHLLTGVGIVAVDQDRGGRLHCSSVTSVSSGLSGHEPMRGSYSDRQRVSTGNDTDSMGRSGRTHPADTPNGTPGVRAG